MDRLPDEILTEVLDYLEPSDLLSLQRVNRRLLKVARDSSIWRFKCFEKAPSAAYAQANNPNALNRLTLGLGGLSIGEGRNDSTGRNHPNPTALSMRASKRAKAVFEWDCTNPSEKINWYSEYVARHAPLNTEWLSNLDGPECRGMALFDCDSKVIGPMEDGSLRVWDLKTAYNGRRTLHESAKSPKSVLFQDFTEQGEPSVRDRSLTMGSTVDNIVVDASRAKAYVAVEDILNEIDIHTLQVVSQQKYAWKITAVSQQAGNDLPLMIGTSFSLHMHDPRIPLKHTSTSGAATKIDQRSDDDRMVFLPNYNKTWSDRQPHAISSNSDSDSDEWNQSNSRYDLESFARVDPGPQSILHRGSHEIIVAGRMPSILFYDRRSFPQLQSVIHSGGRLSGLMCLDVPPNRSGVPCPGDATLIACGEYHGRGSLEVYELPHQLSEQRPSETSTLSPSTENDDCTTNDAYKPLSYRNRQAASSAKILSVAQQGARIVFSDGDGALKWLERDGRGLARRWNINTYELTPYGASISGEHVVRKMTPLAHPAEDLETTGKRGDGDLLVWTGEKLGVVTTLPKWEDHDELVKEFEEKMDLNGHERTVEDEKRKAEEYGRMMRQALERQADERRWMSRFGLKR